MAEQQYVRMADKVCPACGGELVFHEDGLGHYDVSCKGCDRWYEAEEGDGSINYALSHPEEFAGAMDLYPPAEQASEDEV